MRHSPERLLTGPMIHVRDLTYSYPGSGTPAVAALDFDVAAGEVFGLLGPSGAGKSTTQKILIRLLDGFRGTVSVFGRPLEEWRQDYYERIGVSFELPNHFLRLTGLENLRYFGALYERPARDPLELLAEVGLEADGDTAVGEYSKGMKNRLTVARALLHDPDLLFLDEPTAGLDPGNARRIRDLIRAQQARGRTIFLTTHDMSVADDLCDRVAFIVGGRVATIDAPGELRLRFGEATIRVEVEGDGGPAVHDFALADIGTNHDFLRLIRETKIRRIHSREATLEDVFLRVTGRGLE